MKMTALINNFCKHEFSKNINLYKPESTQHKTDPNKQLINWYVN